MASKLEEDQESLVATLIDKEDGGKATRKKKVVSRLGSMYLNVIPDWGQRKKSGARTTKSKTFPLPPLSLEDSNLFFLRRCQREPLWGVDVC